MRSTGQMSNTKMKTLALGRKWRLEREIGAGGFAKVHQVRASDGSVAVAKLIPKTPGASRELLFGEIAERPNVMPILDSGEWGEYYVLVMPRAERSLRERLDEVGSPLQPSDAVPIMLDVATALASLAPDVVHRDLKPDNVLFHQGSWHVADFGIARYAEATTSLDTRRFAMTPEYAAPEQWRSERATPATDVYAFGVLSFELLLGRRPFSGPDFRSAHLHEAAPRLGGEPDWLSALVAECLLKPPSARPLARNIVARLRMPPSAASPSASRLQAVNSRVVSQRAEAAALRSAEVSRQEARIRLHQACMVSLERIVRGLEDAVRRNAPSATVRRDNASASGLTCVLGTGTLSVRQLIAAPPGCLAAHDYAPPFDVVSYSAISVRKPRDRFDYEGRAHSLWYCDAQQEGVFRWYELAFMVHPFIPERGILDPFALDPTDELAGRALTPVMDKRQVAWQPVPIDQGDETGFIDRWLDWFGRAADGSLTHPTRMPEESGGSFRQPKRRSQ